MRIYPETVLEFNSAQRANATELLSGLFGSQELADVVADKRPYVSVDELCNTSEEQLALMSDELVLKAVQAHPPIGAKVREGTLSANEQATAAGDNAANKESAKTEILQLNEEYSQRFGHVFLIRATGLNFQQILDELRKRLSNDSTTEWKITRQQLGAINDLRLRRHFSFDGDNTKTPQPPGGKKMILTTHVLNTSTGLPSARLRIDLSAVELTSEKQTTELLETATTDVDGRYKFAADLATGIYRLRFHTGDYLAESSSETLYPWVDVHFKVKDVDSKHLHVPLLLSPFGYSTYRGS